MAKRTYIAVIEIEKPDGVFHQPWVFTHSIECAVRDISGFKVNVRMAEMSQERVGFVERLLTRLGAWGR